MSEKSLGSSAPLVVEGTNLDVSQINAAHKQNWKRKTWVEKFLKSVELGDSCITLLLQKLIHLEIFQPIYIKHMGGIWDTS
ncbi:unnamed protein product [Allacma fusca]|uniref:Uncharacterized protein n=1 Tax=Allacma fusca TaxID=39272 RepID=A0A8J2NS62_9HEXA|nr:unnamed protein product [Allacma fusca]